MKSYHLFQKREDHFIHIYCVLEEETDLHGRKKSLLKFMVILMLLHSLITMLLAL